MHRAATRSATIARVSVRQPSMIAINAVPRDAIRSTAGLIAAAEAVAAPEFNLWVFSDHQSCCGLDYRHGPVARGCDQRPLIASRRWVATITRAAVDLMQHRRCAAENNRATHGMRQVRFAAPRTRLNLGAVHRAATAERHRTVVGAEGAMNMNTQHERRRRVAARSRDHDPSAQRHTTAADRGSPTWEHADYASARGRVQRPGGVWICNDFTSIAAAKDFFWGCSMRLAAYARMAADGLLLVISLGRKQRTRFAAGLGIPSIALRNLFAPLMASGTSAADTTPGRRRCKSYCGRRRCTRRGSGCRARCRCRRAAGYRCAACDLA